MGTIAFFSLMSNASCSMIEYLKSYKYLSSGATEPQLFFGYRFLERFFKAFISKVL